jgi:pristinamycin I synthase-3/4
VSAPRTPIEIMLCDLWAGALGSPVGIDDDFFTHGGNSLLATKIIAQVKSILGLQIDMSVVFDAPTIREWAAGLVPSTDAPIEPRRSTGAADIPLSSAQQGVWYLEQIAPGRPTYNQRLVWRVRGPLDVDALREAFDIIISRHEILRTAFRTRDGIPYQAIGEASPLQLEPESLPPTEDLTAAILREIRSPFDLERGAPIRVRLLQTGPAEHILILVIHHIVSDAWSLGLLCRELADLYAAGTGGMRSPLPPLAVQYADFAIWQRAYLADERFAADVAYWKSVLQGVPTETVFPSDFPRPALRGDSGARELVSIPDALIATLRGIGQRAGATLYMVLLTAFQVLVSRYSGQDTVVVASPIAGRVRPEVESLIGLFVNILAIRADLAGDPRFDVLLGTMRDYLLRAYVHQNVPFEGLIAQLPRSRDGSGSALTQVAFNLQNVPARPLQLRHLQVERIDIPTVSPKMDLALILREQPAGVSGRLEYDTDLYSQSTIQTFARRYLRLLEAIASAPTNRLSHVAIQ